MKSEKLEMINEKKAVRRMTGNRFVRFAAALALMLMLPIAAMAAGPSNPSGTASWDLTAVNADGNGTGTFAGKWSWVQATKTLTLNGFSHTSNIGYGTIQLPGDSTIVLIGDNTLHNTDTGTMYGCLSVSNGGKPAPLTITGTGTLTVTTANSTTGAYIVGIYCGNLTITGGAVVSVTNGNAASSSSGLNIYNYAVSCSNLTIDGGELTAKGGTVKSSGQNSYGVYCTGTITFKGGVLIAAGKTTLGNQRALNKNVTVNASGYQYKAGADGSNSYISQSTNPFNVGTNVYVELSTLRDEPLDCMSSPASADGEGWAWDASTKTLTLNGAYIKVPEAMDIYNAIKLPDGANISLYSSSTVIYENASSGSGIEGAGDFTISGEGALFAQGKYGMSGANITIESGTVRASGIDGPGIFAAGGDLIINGGTVISIGSSSSSGMGSAGDITINGGTVTAIGGYAAMNKKYIVPEDYNYWVATDTANTTGTADGVSDGSFEILNPTHKYAKIEVVALTPAEVLAAAFGGAGANLTVDEETGTVTVTGSVTLSANAVIPADAILIVADGGSITVSAGATLKVDGGTVQLNNSTGNGINLAAATSGSTNDGGVMVVTSGTVEIKNTGGKGINIADATASGKAGDMKVSGGKVEVSNSGGTGIDIRNSTISGVSNANANMTITGGTVEVKNTSGNGINIGAAVTTPVVMGENGKLSINASAATADVVLLLNGNTTSLSGGGTVSGSNNGTTAKAIIKTGATASSQKLVSGIDNKANSTYKWSGTAWERDIPTYTVFFNDADGTFRKNNASGDDITSEIATVGMAIGGNTGAWVFTLNGFDFETTAATALSVPAGTTIVLASGTTNTILRSGTPSSDTRGINALGDLAITGSGTLNVTSGEFAAAANYSSVGINLPSKSSNTLTITDATVNVTSDPQKGRNNTGILGKVTVESGTVTVTAGSASYGASPSLSVNGIEGSEVVVNGGTLTVTAGNVTNTSSTYPAYSRGIAGNLTVSGGTVATSAGTANATSAAADSFGIDGDLSVTGGSVTSIGNTSAISSDYTVPDGYKYFVNTTTSASTSELPSDGTAEVGDTHKYAKIVYAAAAETLGTLTVSLTAGDGKVTLAKQTAETGFKFYYKSTAASQAASKPALDATFSAGGWTELTANADITGANGTEIFVQVVKVETSGSKIKAWGEDSATPALGAPVITINTQPAGNTTVTEGEISGSLTVAASVTQGKTLSYQWYKNSTNSNSGGTAESGATSASFTIPTGLAKGTYYYYCVVSADGGAADVASSVAAVKVTGPPYNITFNRREGFGGTAEITAYEGTQMPQITPPVFPGSSKSFNGYYSEEDGEGTKYYDKDGKSVNTGNSDHDELHAYFK